MNIPLFSIALYTTHYTYPTLPFRGCYSSLVAAAVATMGHPVPEPTHPTADLLMGAIRYDIMPPRPTNRSREVPDKGVTKNPRVDVRKRNPVRDV